MFDKVRYNKNWLPHLEGSLPKEAWRNQISMYTIALEGWRRGLTLKFFSVLNEERKWQIHYSLSNQGREHLFKGSEGDKITAEAVKVCSNKAITNEFLAKAGIPIPQGNMFRASNTDDEIVDYAKTIGFPLVLKPTDGSGGRGVIVNIKGPKELREAFQYVRQQLKFNEVIVEEYIQGNEVRVYVLGEKVIGAVHRRPPNVVGDGKNSIRELIDIKNEERKTVPHLYNRPIKIDRQVRHTIRSLGYTLDSVPKKGERVFLRKISNISVGGEPVDVTGELTPSIKNIAINAAKAIPGLTHCGVDMIVNQKNDTGIVIEVNTAPGIGSHLFPIEGKARDIPKAIIDYYFPETIKLNSKKSNAYFDYKTIEESLKSCSMNEIEVSPAPLEKPYSKKLTISEFTSEFNSYNIITKHALSQNLNGFVRKGNNHQLEVIVSGEKRRVEQFKKALDRNHHFRSQVVDEEDWGKPIKVGFYISDGTELMSLHALEIELNHMQKKIDSVKRETKRLERQIKKIEDSHSWKYTLLVRKSGDLIKKIRRLIS